MEKKRFVPPEIRIIELDTTILATVITSIVPDPEPTPDPRKFPNSGSVDDQDLGIQ